jgi:deoxyribodipyrimidine photolyase-related protein
MLVSNYCTLVGIEPKEVLNWFQSVFIDAYDWVMIPNVMGMGLYADGGRVGTKPYISSANYINKMGDYCQDCAFDYKKRTGEKACPFNFLYWNFLLEQEERLRENHRMARMLYNLKYLDKDERQGVRISAEEHIARKHH